MPLRALLDGEDVVAPAVPRAEWEALRRAARAKERDLRLPCCGRRALQRTSRRGLQHFYHPPGSPCEEPGETLDHLQAKLAILAGCELAGYPARTECRGEGWRADVLAARGRTGIAFEAQWSRQTLAETVRRQEEYARHGLRGCWFFRAPPLGARRTDERPLVARSDLPLFLLSHDPLGSPHVYLNGRHYPLDRLVAALLRGEICFRARARIERWQWADLLFFPVRCPCCGSEAHAFRVERPAYRASCGLPVPASSGRYAALRAARRAEVQRAVWAFLQTDAGLGLRVGMIKERRLPGNVARPSFGCPSCDAPFEDRLLGRVADQIGKAERWTARHRVPVTIRGPFMWDYPHWCYPEGGEPCVEPQLDARVSRRRAAL